jgi:hypothetical protein
MQQAFDQFKSNIKYVKELDSLYVHLHDVLHLPNDLSDLLRAEWVYTVSAMDKLIHELVRTGMIDAFQGKRIKTKKFLTFAISVDTYSNITVANPPASPPPEYYFEQEILQKHKHLSFQEPEKIADALSLVWDEQHKWGKLAQSMGMPEASLTTRLKTIISRRNQIVHEADVDLQTGLRNKVEKVDADSVVSFIEELGEEIFKAVK